MPIKDGREYRNIAIENFSAVDDSYIVEGYATTFDVPYDFMPGYQECIRKSALEGADMSDVIFQFDHNGMVMARLRNNTLSLFIDDHGLKVSADLKGSQQGRELYEAIKNGLVDRMSWAFRVAEDGWEFDKENRISYITKVEKVYDVSAVSIPANDDTEINARSYLDGVIEEMEREEFALGSDDMKVRQESAIRLLLA